MKSTLSITVPTSIKKRLLSAMLAVIGLSVIFTLNIQSENTNIKNDEDYAPLENEIDLFQDSIPENIKKYLPNEIFSDDSEVVIDSIYDAVETKNLLEAIFDGIKINMNSIIKNFGVLLGLIILSAILKTIKESMASSESVNTLGFCADIALLSAFLSEGLTSIEVSINFLNSLNLFITGILPATASLYAAGGNIKAAVASTTGFLTFLSVSNFICNRILKLVCSICLALTLCMSVAPSLNLKSLIAFVRKTFILILSFVMMILLFTMTAQTSLSAASDGIAARTAKFVIGNAIPIVGGSVSDTVRTLSTSISFLRKTIGIAAVVVIFVMFVPHLVNLIIQRGVYLLIAVLADIFGCEKQGFVMREMANIYGNIIAVTSMCSIMFIFSLTMFSFSAVAIGTG